MASIFVLFVNMKLIFVFKRKNLMSSLWVKTKNTINETSLQCSRYWTFNIWLWLRTRAIQAVKDRQSLTVGSGKDFSKITDRRRLNGCNSKTKTNIMMSPSCEILVMHRETNAQWHFYLSGFLAKTRRLGPILGLGLFLGLSVPDIDAIYNTKINRKRLPDMAVPKCYQYTIEVLIFGLKQPLLS